MTSIDWDYVQHFSRDAFAVDPDKYISPQIVHNLEQFRRWYGSPIHPSPVERGLARFKDRDEGSRHYAVGRLSDALDWFPEGSVQQAWLLAISCGLFGAVGIYTNTKFRGRKWTMFHTDNRPGGVGHSRTHPLLWWRNEDGYFYLQYDREARQRFFGLLDKLD
jgi:hypothetical protein